MFPFEISLQSNIARAWFIFIGIILKLQGVLIGFLIVGLGVLLGCLMSSPESAELTISILVIFLQLLIIINNPLYGLILWIMFHSFIETWIEIPMGAGLPDLSFARFTMAFLSVFLLARAAISKFRFAPISLADFSIVATFLGVMSAALLSVNSREVIQWSISLYLTPLIMYFFAKNLVQDKETLHKVLLAVTLFGFAAALYAIYEQTTGHILFLPKGQSAEGLRTSYTENLRQIRGLLGKPGEFGRVFTASIPVTFYLFFESKAIKGKLLLVGMLVIQAYGIFLTYNRTSWYALLFSLFILQLFYPQFRKMFFIIVFVAVVALWATWDQVNESAVVEERLNEKTENFNGRTPRWEAGMNMWKAKPIRGWGFGWYQRESGRFRTDGDPRNFRSIESDYLHILVGSGLIGFVPYLLFLVVPLINSLRLFFRARAPDWPGSVKPETIAVYWCIIISFAMGSYTQILTQPIVKMLLAITAGAIVGSHEYLLYRSKTKVSSIAELPATVLPGK